MPDQRTPDRRIPVDHVCPDFVPGRELRVTDLVLEELVAGEPLLRVEYTITPALPPRGRRPTVASWPVVWDATAATDDQGTAYRDGGGAWGPAPGGDRTTGTLTISPAPPPAARRLRVVLRAWFPWATPVEAFRECVVEVELTAASD
ncbi:MAG TPA: hypothetical protein VNK05_15265 [Chloroflexota bacterium]|jgi:hypothetical protein|nr:hypothetical protein [Chloroflexota bacterium]